MPPNDRDPTDGANWESVPELQDDDPEPPDEVTVSELGETETPEGALLGGGGDGDPEVMHARRPETDGAGDPEGEESGLLDRLVSAVASAFGR